ncbi:MAG: [protein-PII] uridylyltransferase [Burkholderiaceae bacterium]|nr:[protein-PII] uridylyltransferase [Burkholderiaceae bacterium]
MTGNAIEQAPALVALRDRYRLDREQAIEDFTRHPAPGRLLASLSRAADRCLRGLWASTMPDGGALAAVGGYGRAELFPQSDVDLLILLPAAPGPELTPCLERFIGACWDCGLEIGHSVRTIDECLREAESDVTVRTNLLERRPLAGSRRLYSLLGKRMESGLDPRAFRSAKILEMRQRHVKFDDTPYSLEPNTKESPGGLRDLQTMQWIARAAGFGANWNELAQAEILNAEELRVLRGAERQIRQIRAMLHVTARRREDRLVFDLQAQVAAALGIGDGSARRASEALMQRYFLAAKSVSQLTTIILQNIDERLFDRAGHEPEPIDAEFCNREGLLETVDDDLFERDPSAILRAFLRLQQRSELSGMSTRTLRAMWHARDRIDAAFRSRPENRALFLQLLKSERGVTHELRRMNQWSLLGRFLPPFRRIVGRMQHDLFHVYTVDQHILMVVRNLRRLTIPEHAHEYPLCSQLMASLERRWLLYIGALFHDIAKGRGGDHSLLGRADARRFCRQHGMSRDETSMVVFLVEHHLTMSQVAQRQDLSEPAVIQRFAGIVRNEERLTMLYLLTVADIRGTSPKVWNAWKGKLLEDLFRATKRELAGDTPDAAERLDAKRAEAVRLLNLYALSPDVYREFWSRLDIAYFLRNDVQDVAWHTRMLSRHTATRTPVVRSRLAPIGEGFQIVVYLPDQEDLFARICGYFDSKSLSVLDARIHTTEHGYALDSFLVIDPSGASRYRDILALVESELTERLKRRTKLAQPIRGRLSRRSRYFPVKPSIDLRPDENRKHFLLSIVANDRTGLLYRIAMILGKHGVNIYTARIATLGERAEDVFLVDGPPLTNPKHQIQIETELLAALQPD